LSQTHQSLLINVSVRVCANAVKYRCYGWDNDVVSFCFKDDSVLQDEDRSSERRDEVERFDEEGEDEGELSSDADDFIVDDDGRPIADKRRKRKPIYTDA